MNTHTIHRLAVGIVLMLSLAAGAQAQSPTLRASVLSAGGDYSTGAGVTLHSTLGQVAVGPMTGTDYRLGQGFWPYVSGIAGPLALPTAVDDAVTTDEDTPVDIDVLSNDTTPGGGTLSITTLGVPAYGTVEQTGAGTLTYTPEADFYGDDTFTYLVANEQGGSAQATVSVTVQAINDAPVFTSTPVIGAVPGAVYTYTVEATDIEGDALAFSAPVLPPGWLSLTDNGDGTAVLEGTPSASHIGRHTVTLAVYDGEATTEQTFAVTVTSEVPGVPVLVEPANGTTDLTDAIRLVWEAVPGAALYDLDLSLQEDFSSYESRIRGIADTTWTLYSLAGSTTYYWRIRAVNDIGDGVFSAPYRFSTVVSVANEEEGEIPGQFELHQNYPNPFNPSTTIAYAVPQTATVRLAVYDLFGREVKVLVQATQPPGHYTVAFDAGDLASGTYFYRIEAGSWSRAKQLVLLK